MNTIEVEKPETRREFQARLATLDELIENVLPNFISPIPTRETLRAWFAAAGVPCFKTNCKARRGGGVIFYSVAGIEKFFRSRMLPAGAALRSLPS